MNTRTIMRLLAPALIVAMAPVAGCNDASPPNAQEVTSTSTNSANQLPNWLQKGPDDWGQEAWLPYQASLIEMRNPILRTGDYTADELEIVTAELEHFPGEYRDKIKQEWLTKWRPQLTSYERTGGCGCCNEVYTVTGPKVAMEEFPDYYRNHYPRRTSSENGG